jgi:hypothetical protein
MDAPLRVLSLALLGCVLLVGPAVVGIAAVALFPASINSPVSWIAMSFIWSVGALRTGSSLVGMAPRRGMAACATLAVVGETLLVALVVRTPRPDLLDVQLVLSHTTGLPLLPSAARQRNCSAAYDRPHPPCRGSRSMSRRILHVLCALPLAPQALRRRKWSGRTRHRTRRGSTVDDTVQLEVLNWGGSGPALVLLAGLGATAHYYDDFAPALTAHYRVVGITRRGHRGSSAAPGGYGFARLAEDVVRVMDAVDVTNAVVIGHSFAGEEMHVLGARYSAKIAWCMSMRRSIVETTRTTKPSMRWRERCQPLPVPNQETLRPSRLCVRIWRSTAALGPRRTCGPGTARILTEASVACGPRTLRSVKR